MIRFQVDSKGYKIEWMDEPYEQLYMFYEPKGALFRYEGRFIQQTQYDPNTILYENYILAPPVEHPTQGLHNRKLPIGNYRCSLYSDRNRSGKPLRWEDVFIGTRIEVIMRRENYKDRFDYLYVESYCRFPQNSIYLTFEPCLGEKIVLPEMFIGENNLYRTRCIVPPGAYQKLTVAVSQNIRDCVFIRK